MRKIWLPWWELSHTYSFFAQYIRGFENLKHIFQYSTPIILKKYSQIFTYTIPIIYAPYFAYISQDNPISFSFILPIMLSIIFTNLSSIQKHLEDSFNQKWNDWVKIKPIKFKENLDL